MPSAPRLPPPQRLRFLHLCRMRSRFVFSSRPASRARLASLPTSDSVPRAADGLACTASHSISLTVSSCVHTCPAPVAAAQSIEAMRLYVRTLEEDNPGWWHLLTEGDDTKATQLAAAAAAAARAAASGQAAAILAAAPGGNPGSSASGASAQPAHALERAAQPNEWTAVSAAGEPPRRRYEHAAAVLGDKMYVVGGNSNGRLLGDNFALDLRSLTWSRVDAAAGKFRPPHLLASRLCSAQALFLALTACAAASPRPPRGHSGAPTQRHAGA